MNKELEAIKALGFEYEVLQIFKKQPPAHMFVKKVEGTDRFEIKVFVEYRPFSDEWMIRSVLRDVDRCYSHGFKSASMTIYELEAFIAFAKTLKKGEPISHV